MGETTYSVIYYDCGQCLWLKNVGYSEAKSIGSLLLGMKRFFRIYEEIDYAKKWFPNPVGNEPTDKE